MYRCEWEISSSCAPQSTVSSTLLWRLGLRFTLRTTSKTPRSTSPRLILPLSRLMPRASASKSPQSFRRLTNNGRGTTTREGVARSADRNWKGVAKSAESEKRCGAQVRSPQALGSVLPQSLLHPGCIIRPRGSASSPQFFFSKKQERNPLNANMPHQHGQGPAQQGPQPLPGVDSIIAVGSGKGGVGKTTLSVNLAVALAKMGHKVGLLDADVYGPNVPLMLGVNSQPRMIGENRIEPIEAFGLKVISVGFLNPGDKPVIWRGPMLHQIIRQFLGLVEWGHLDHMVVDLPPGTGDVVLSLVQTVPLTGAVVVSTPSDVSLQDARKALEMFAQVNVEILGIVENMSHFTCPHCQKEIDIFSKGGAERTAKQFNVPFLGSIELVPAIREGGDRGLPVAAAGPEGAHARSFYELAERVVARVEEVKAA